MQSRIVCNTIDKRRSNASKCGGQSIGANGSFDIDSSTKVDKPFGSLCKLAKKKIQNNFINLISY